MGVMELHERPSQCATQVGFMLLPQMLRTTFSNSCWRLWEAAYTPSVKCMLGIMLTFQSRFSKREEESPRNMFFSC